MKEDMKLYAISGKILSKKVFNEALATYTMIILFAGFIIGFIVGRL